MIIVSVDNFFLPFPLGPVGLVPATHTLSLQILPGPQLSEVGVHPLAQKPLWQNSPGGQFLLVVQLVCALHVLVFASQICPSLQLSGLILHPDIQVNPGALQYIPEGQLSGF